MPSNTLPESGMVLPPYPQNPVDQFQRIADTLEDISTAQELMGAQLLPFAERIATALEGLLDILRKAGDPT